VVGADEAEGERESRGVDLEVGWYARDSWVVYQLIYSYTLDINMSIRELDGHLVARRRHAGSSAVEEIERHRILHVCTLRLEHPPKKEGTLSSRSIAGVPTSRTRYGSARADEVRGWRARGRLQASHARVGVDLHW